MTMTPYLNYLADVACQRPTTHVQPPITDNPSALIMDVFKHIGSPAPRLPITRHGIDAMIDVLFAHPVFQNTLTNATDIQEHFAVTFLRHTSEIFKDHWTYVILPAWNHHAAVWKLCDC